MSPKQDTWSLLFGRPTIMRATTRAKPRLAMVTLRAKPHKAAQSQAARESGATDPACVHKRTQGLSPSPLWTKIAVLSWFRPY